MKGTPSTCIPSNEQSFLRVDDNKTELFSLLPQQAVTFPIEEGKDIATVEFVSLHQRTDLT